MIPLSQGSIEITKIATFDYCRVLNRNEFLKNFSVLLEVHWITCR